MRRVAIIVALLAVATVARGDIIELHNGTKIECTIVLEDGKKVFFKENGQTKALKVEEISGIIRSKNNPSNPPHKSNPKPKAVLTPNPGHNPRSENPGKENPGKENPGKENPGPAPVRTEEPDPEDNPEEAPPSESEPELPKRRISRTSDLELSKLFESLQTTCEAIVSSSSKEEETFYRMRAIILKKHINSCGYIAGKIALDELEDMPISTWKNKALLVGFLADIVSECSDRDILPYFWEEWIPYNLKRVESANNREFPMSQVKKIISNLQTAYGNMFRSVQYSLRPYKYRGIQRYAVDKKAMRMPK